MSRLFNVLFGEPKQTTGVMEDLHDAFPMMLLISLVFVWVLWVTGAVLAQNNKRK